MLLLLILPAWTLGLLLVAALCYGARLGDSRLELEARDDEPAAPFQPPARAHARRQAAPPAAGRAHAGSRREPREIAA